MRRSIAIAGFAAAGILLLFTAKTVAATITNVPAKRDEHQSLIQDLAFCEKGYEIAISFSSYASRSSATVEERAKLLARVDELEAKKDRVSLMIDGPVREHAKSLGINRNQYTANIAKVRATAELAAILSVQAVSDPEEFTNRLDDVCEPYIRK